MVENLLSVTRIDGGQIHVEKTPTVLEELIDTALVRFAKRYPAQTVDVRIPETFVSIPMDAMLIEQVIVNLLENALEHAKGLTRIELNVTVRQAQAVFEVCDDGCGIPRDKLDRLFSGGAGGGGENPDSGKRSMGIGLPVCATIVRAHGGVIRAENRATGGAVFRFTLPMEENDHAKQSL